MCAWLEQRVIRYLTVTCPNERGLLLLRLRRYSFQGVLDVKVCVQGRHRDQLKTCLYHDLRRLQLISFLRGTNVSKSFRPTEPRSQYG